MSLNALTTNETKKITSILDAGESVLEEVDTLKEGLKDAIKNLAEELEIKPAIINKAIRLSYKSRTGNAIEKAQEEMSDVEVILHAAGRM